MNTTWEVWGEDHSITHTTVHDALVSTTFPQPVSLFGQESDTPYETTVTGGAMDQTQEQYATRNEAEAGHRAMCRRVQGQE